MTRLNEESQHFLLATRRAGTGLGTPGWAGRGWKAFWTTLLRALAAWAV